jgi:hypothetical protein
MFTEETIGRDDVREPALSTLDADFAVHATAIEDLYRTILTEIADAARAWTPETARLKAQASRTEAVPAPRRATRAESRAAAEAREEERAGARTEAITLPRSEPRTEAITAPRTDAITVQQAPAQQDQAPVRTRGAHHAETGQMAAIPVRPAVPRTLAA